MDKPGPPQDPVRDVDKVTGVKSSNDRTSQFRLRRPGDRRALLPRCHRSITRAQVSTCCERKSPLISPRLAKLLRFRALSSVEEHFLHTEGVAGSSPAARTILMDVFQLLSDSAKPMPATNRARTKAGHMIALAKGLPLDDRFIARARAKSGRRRLC